MQGAAAEGVSKVEIPQNDKIKGPYAAAPMSPFPHLLSFLFKPFYY